MSPQSPNALLCAARRGLAALADVRRCRVGGRRLLVDDPLDGDHPSGSRALARRTCRWTAPAPEPEAIVFEEPSALVEAVEAAEEVVAPPSPMVEAASEAAVDTPKPKIKARPAADGPPTA